MKKKLKISETQYKMIKEYIDGNNPKTTSMEKQMAYHSLKIIIEDFMLNGNVDPEYKQLIQQELDTINKLEGKK